MYTATKKNENYSTSNNYLIFIPQ